MWNSFTTDAIPSIRAGMQTVMSMQGDEIQAYVAEQEGTGPFPGVVFIPHAPGFNEILFEYARRFAFHGFTTAVPNTFIRYGHSTPDDVVARMRGDGGVSDDSVIADAHGTLRYLKTLPSSNGKVGVIGFCSAGRLSLLVASVVPEFDACADCWGAQVVATPQQLSEKRPYNVVELTPQLTVPLIGLFGNDDMSPSPAQVDQHEAALQAAGKVYRFHRYDGAPHTFVSYDRTSYRPQAAMDAWDQIEDWFNTYLRPASM
jgi:carboxymethylenebutenolidase